MSNSNQMPYTILIAEDYEDSRYLLKFMLEDAGYRVIEAKDGNQAVEQTKKERPDLILMDMSMPALDGLAATQEIRALENDREVPIIAITAHGHLYLDRALAVGCNELIGKPIDFEMLETMLSQYLAA